MEGMKKVKKVMNGSAESQGEWENTAWWPDPLDQGSTFRETFFFNLLIHLSVEREQPVLPNTDTAAGRV